MRRKPRVASIGDDLNLRRRWFKTLKKMLRWNERIYECGHCVHVGRRIKAIRLEIARRKSI